MYHLEYLNQMFIRILKSSTNVDLEDEECKFVYERCVSIIMKKANLPSNPTHALEQLRIWVQLRGVICKDVFGIRIIMVGSGIWSINFV